MVKRSEDKSPDLRNGVLEAVGVISGVVSPKGVSSNN